jgi:hypothetical protein
MFVSEHIVRFLPSVTILSVIISICIFSIVHVLRSRESSCAETWTANERTRVWWMKIGTAIAVILCWTGALISAVESPPWVDGAINWSLFNGDTHVLDVGLFGIVVIGLPTLATAFWLKLLRHNWSDGEAPSTTMYFYNYSLWLALIWSKLLIGW